ncbi:hypothetical protein J0S82_018650 [Galemys pyrenaicus]|uniref:Uncharacterized protein n=1 Tax=Galemys pyrenaicus TaxID=202257 RepID=A0A8J6DP68_GALPY|nr:hypothetical protein J0S82_018650 [Galemys pyrenaicus]
MAASEDGSGCLVSRGRSQSDPSVLADSSTDAGENPAATKESKEPVVQPGADPPGGGDPGQKPARPVWACFGAVPYLEVWAPGDLHLAVGRALCLHLGSPLVSPYCPYCPAPSPPLRSAVLDTCLVLPLDTTLSHLADLVHPRVGLVPGQGSPASLQDEGQAEANLTLQEGQSQARCARSAGGVRSGLPAWPEEPMRVPRNLRKLDSPPRSRSLASPRCPCPAADRVAAGGDSADLPHLVVARGWGRQDAAPDPSGEPALGSCDAQALPGSRRQARLSWSPSSPGRELLATSPGLLGEALQGLDLPPPQDRNGVSAPRLQGLRPRALRTSGPLHGQPPRPQLSSPNQAPSEAWAWASPPAVSGRAGSATTPASRGSRPAAVLGADKLGPSPAGDAGCQHPRG